MSTNVLTKSQITRNWHVIDAKDKILGRVAVEIAKLIRGKNKVNFVTYIDNGDYVVVINAKDVQVTGKKETQKKYYRNSGYQGGLKTETFDKLLARKPEEVIRHAVKGMLPHTKLGREMIKKLHVYAGAEYPKLLGDRMNSKTLFSSKEEGVVANA